MRNIIVINTLKKQLEKRGRLMKYFESDEWFFLLTFISVFGLPTIATAGTEGNVEVSLFNLGDSKSKTGGNAQVGTSGMIIEAEYEINHKIFSIAYERWNYNWTNPASLPFASGITTDPWNSLNTIQLGLAYESKINKHWEFIYYLEAESSYEKQTSNSYEYEAGVKFVYEPSKSWAYTLVADLEYLDVEGTSFGIDLEVEWNPDAKKGWSGEFILSTEFPETTLSYHFTRAFSTSMFYKESGTSLIRLSDSSPVPGIQAGYFEDQYNALGIRLDYEFARKQNLSFSFQQNTGRIFTFLDKSGVTETIYEFDDTTEVSVMYSHEF